MHFYKTLHSKLNYDIRYMMYWVGIWEFVVKHIWKYQAGKILNSNAGYYHITKVLLNISLMTTNQINH